LGEYTEGVIKMSCCIFCNGSGTRRQCYPVKNTVINAWNTRVKIKEKEETK
jgi:hypothetical protein